MDRLFAETVVEKTKADANVAALSAAVAMRFSAFFIFFSLEIRRFSQFNVFAQESFSETSSAAADEHPRIPAKADIAVNIVLKVFSIAIVSHL